MAQWYFIRLSSRALNTIRVKQKSTKLGIGYPFDTDHLTGIGDEGNGDGVTVAPRRRDPIKGCPARQDSCPRSNGQHIVCNFLDYSDDVYLSTFTTGQENRMHAMWDTGSYRASTFSQYIYMQIEKIKK